MNLAGMTPCKGRHVAQDHGALPPKQANQLRILHHICQGVTVGCAYHGSAPVADGFDGLGFLLCADLIHHYYLHRI